MRLGPFADRRDLDDLFQRFLVGGDAPPTLSNGFSVPTDVFHLDDKLVIRMDLPGVSPDEVEVTVQESNLIINGKRSFPYEADSVRFMRRGTFYGDFTQRVALGRGLDLENVGAAFDNGVLELTIPYTQEVQPRKISIEVGSKQKALNN